MVLEESGSCEWVLRVRGVLVWTGHVSVVVKPEIRGDRERAVSGSCRKCDAESAHPCQVYRELVTRLHGGPDSSNLDCCFYEPPNPDDDKLTVINEPMYHQDPGVFAFSCSEQQG